MRMRRKRWARPELSKCEYYIKNPCDAKGKWLNLFKKAQPLHLELGCGKGVFLSKLARCNLDVNFIGIDMSDDILGVARRNIEKEFEGIFPKNILLTRYNVEYCDKIFDSNDIVDRIYIYFCNPWPRPKHHKKRLTHFRQLDKYKNFLNKNGIIHFKTDDDSLFSDSKKYFESSGFKIEYITHDLHNSEYVENNLLSEHEILFSNQGIPIKFLIARVAQ